MVATEPERLAQHCADAGLAEKAIQYWLMAGQRSLATLGDGGSGRAAAPGVGAAFRRRRRWPAPGAGTRAPDLSRPRLDGGDGPRVLGDGGRLCPRPRAVRAAAAAAAAGAGAVWPMHVRIHPRRARFGAGACRCHAAVGGGRERSARPGDELPDDRATPVVPRRVRHCARPPRRRPRVVRSRGSTLLRGRLAAGRPGADAELHFRCTRRARLSGPIAREER